MIKLVRVYAKELIDLLMFLKKDCGIDVKLIKGKHIKDANGVFYPPSKIFLNAGISNCSMYMAAIHELQHFLHFKKLCNCHGSKKMSEYHAYRDTLKFFIKNGFNEFVAEFIDDCDNFVKKEKRKQWENHIKAVKMLKKTRWYSTAKRIARKQRLHDTIKKTDTTKYSR